MLSNPEIIQKAPSVQNLTPFGNCSERYRIIPTLEVIDGLRNEGWFPVSAFQSRTLDASRKHCTKHVVRFRRNNIKPVVGDVFPEIILTNSHDGSTAYRLNGGLFRLACSNGMMVSEYDMPGISVRHSGDVVGRVIEGSLEIVSELPQVIDSVESMAGIQITPNEQLAYARAALALRYENPDDAPYSADALLKVRRRADLGNDLWRTFNRVQENMLRGGISGLASSGRRMRTRAVTSISEDQRLNKALWTLAREMQTMKSH